MGLLLFICVQLCHDLTSEGRQEAATGLYFNCCQNKAMVITTIVRCSFIAVIVKYFSITFKVVFEGAYEEIVCVQESVSCCGALDFYIVQLPTS